MAIALTTFLLFLFLIPGILFQNAFNTAHGEAINRNPLSASFTHAVVASVFLHVLWLSATFMYAGFPDPDFARIYSFLGGNAALFPAQNEAPAFAAYMISLMFAGQFAGNGLRYLVDSWYLSSAALRCNPFYNDASWASTLREPSIRLIKTWRGLHDYRRYQNMRVSEVYKNKKFDTQKQKEFFEENKNYSIKNLITPYLVVKIAGDHENALYRGQLLSFKTNESGALKRIKLIDVEKKLLDNYYSKFKNITNDEFVLICDNIISLNIYHINTAESFLGPPE